MNRREFLKTAMAAGVTVIADRYIRVAEAVSTATNPTTGPAVVETRQGSMIYRALGTTGEKISLLGVGGFHIGKLPTKNDAVKLIRSAIDQGVNFMDNSWDYNGGRSEEWMGEALRDGYRQKVFLMTKIDGRTKDSAARQLEESLARLQVEHLDLLQFHEVIRMNDPDRIFAPGGAIEAAIDARKAGRIRFIGFTGHKDPKIHLHMLDTAKRHGFRFDTVQMPLNVMDAHFRSFQHMVLPVLVREKIGVLAMKSIGNGIILQSHTVTPVECLQYAMSLPVSTVISGIDSPQILAQNLGVVATFKPLTDQQVRVLLARTREAAANGQYEKFKTAAQFDSTARTPQWMG